MNDKPEAVEVTWCGTEDEQWEAALEACAERRKQWGGEPCDHTDMPCSECEWDMALALRCPRKGCDHLKGHEHDR